ncbi:G-protein coupled receptor 157-like isoform X2 [Corticium candelabrum]|uniref:G-protein coupled receptor 157-like isoform X2 n=1 Tax=Corticium candelabrum TaxID=121492 RepID=UPI002E26C519|nr:G-protein coupled receptor 157-like isoform X2 [Corticium candelabrum]
MASPTPHQTSQLTPCKPLGRHGSPTMPTSHISKDLRTTSRLLLVFLSLMDFGTALSNSIGMVAGFKETTTGCQVQAAFAIFCSLSSYFWTAAIALYLYFTIVRDQQFVAKKLVKVFHVVAWGIPLIIVSVAGGLDVLGLDVTDPLEHSKEMTVSLTGGWCFIRSPANQSVFSSNGSLNFVSQSPEWFSDVWFDFWVMMASVAWQIATFFFCVIIYLLIKIHIYKEKHRSSQVFVTHRLLRTADSVDRKLTFIPIVFFLLYICAVIRSFGRIFHSHHIIYNKPLIVLQGIFDSLQGAANCVIFCLFTKAVRNRIAACICSYCPRSSHHSRQQRGVNVNQSHRVVTSEYFNEPMFDRKKSADWPDCRGYSGNSEVTPLVHDVR